jgi:hypothetical protein
MIMMTLICCQSLFSHENNNKQVEQVSIQNQDLIRLELSKQRRAEQYEALIGETNESLKTTSVQKPK